MVVNVRYITTVREVTKKQSEKIELEENATMHDLINKLVEIYGGELRKIILTQGVSTVSIACLMGTLANDGAFQPILKLDTKLSEGTTILMGTVVTGG